MDRPESGGTYPSRETRKDLLSLWSGNIQPSIKVEQGKVGPSANKPCQNTNGNRAIPADHQRDVLGVDNFLDVVGQPACDTLHLSEGPRLVRSTVNGSTRQRTNGKSP
jgi:hypothetical protein